VSAAHSVLAATPRSLVATVQHVANGDSITIDAPEVARNGKPGQPFGEEAREYLDHLIGGKTIRIDAYGPDQYKRILGVIWDDQVNVNLLMVAMGLPRSHAARRVTLFVPS
jgi:endonuclease YncB( thermonuclease family)